MESNVLFGIDSQAIYPEAYQKYLLDFEERERALINGYNSEITKYKSLVSQLRLQLAHTKSSGSHLSPGKGKENLTNQAQLKQYLLRQVKRLQDELDKNSQSVAEVTQALELKKASEIDLEQRLAYETAGHRQAKALISDLKSKVKRLGERCRSASFEAEKTLATIESELCFIQNQSISVKEDVSEQESFQSAIENSFELTKGGSDNKVANEKENQSLNVTVIGDVAGEQEKKTKKKALGENGSNFRLDPGCLEQKIITKNMEIVRLQEQLLVQSKLERDLKELNNKNEELVQQLKFMAQLQTELKKKASLIRGLEDKLQTTEVLEVEVESQALVIQRLQAAVDERSVLLAKLQNCPSQPTSNGSSPVSDRKLEELETVMIGLREMVDRSTKELSKKDEKIQSLSDEKKSSVESLENEVQSMKTAVDSLEAELQSLKKEKEAFEVLKKTLENELETLKVENATISESKNSLGKELEDSNKKNKEICNLKNSLEKSLENLKLENKTINDLKNSLEKELEKSKKEKEEIYNSKDSSVKSLENLRLENKTINDLKNSLEKELEALKADHKTISSLKNSLEKDLENSKTEVKTLSDLKSSLTKELESLKAENESISSMKNSLEKDLKNSEEEKQNISDAKNSMEKEILILKEENESILKQKESLNSELLSVKSELDSKSLEIVSLKSDLLSKELVGEKSNIKATNELKNSLALAKMAQRELEENLEAKKKELRAKDAELTKKSKLLEEKNQENIELESKITVLSKEQDAAKCGVNESTNELQRKKETTDNLQSGNDGEGSSSSLEEEVRTLEKSLDDNVCAREKLLVEISGLVSSLTEKDRQITELTNRKDKDENTSKNAMQVTSDEETSVAQWKGALDTEKQRCEELTMKLEMATKEVDRLKSVHDQNLVTNGLCSQVKTNETVDKEDNGKNTQENKVKQTPNDLGQDMTVLRTELQKVQSSLDAERSVNETLQFELDAANAKLYELRTDYDNEKNVSFNLKYELDDVKGSLSEVLDSFDQLNQTKNDAPVEKKGVTTSGEIDKKIMENLEPETKQIVEESSKLQPMGETPNDLGQDTTVLRTELQKVQSSLDAERSVNETLQFELDAANAKLYELRTDYDNEKNVSFNLKYELDDVKGSLSEVLDSFDQLNQTKNDAPVEKKGVTTSGEIDKKIMENLEPETKQIVEESSKLQPMGETPNDLGQDTTVLRTELQKVQSSLDAERSVNETLQFELDAANAKLYELRTDYDNEKNVSFNLKYELDDVKGSLSEVLDSFDQLNQTKNDAPVEKKGVTTSGEIDKKIMENLEPETKQIVEDLQGQIKSWQTKYEESSLELISERQKLLDAQNSRSENFYLRRDNSKLQKEISSAKKQMHELVSRQEIQQITLETDQMTKKLVEDRKKSEEQHLRADLVRLREELDTTREKVILYGELEAEVKQLREKVSSLEVADEIKNTPQKPTASLEEVDQTPGDVEVRLEEKYKYEGRREIKEKDTNINEEKSEECKDIRGLGYDEMRREMAVLARELATAQRETQYLRDKVEAKEKVGGLTSTPLLETKVGSNRQLRREKIEAENAKMEAEFALKIAREEIKSLTKRLEKYEREVLVDTNPQLDSVVALENSKKEVLRLKDKLEEYNTKCAALNDQTETEKSQKLEKELQDLEINIKEEKAKVSKLQDDLAQKRCVVGILKESLKEQEDIMIGFEKLLEQKDETINRLNTDLSEEKKSRQTEKENISLPRPSLEKEKLKTVVSNQTETIQVLSQRNTQQELNCETIRNEMQNMKMSLTIIAAERDSLRKRLHLVETSAMGACKCNINNSNISNINNNSNNKVTAQTQDTKSPQKLSHATEEKKKMVLSDSNSSSDDQYWRQQKALVVDSINKAASRRRLEPENSSPKPLAMSPACQTRRVKRTSGPHPERASCSRKKICLSPESDQSSPAPPEKSPPGSGPPRKEYIEIDVTPPVAAKALKKNRKRKPIELHSQEMPIETPSRPNRRSKSLAMKKIQQMSSNGKETSPINKKIKAVDDVKTSASDDQMSDSSISKGKNALSRFKNLTSSFRSNSFKGAKNILTSPRTWSMKDSPKKDVPASPKVPWNYSTRKVTASPASPVPSKKTNATLNTSDADSKRHRELRNVLADGTVVPQRKRRLYKEEIIGPMSYESQIVKTRTMTTVRPIEDVFSIVKQQLRARHK